jgi:hypothetical protein
MFHNVPAKLSRSAEQRPSNLAHLMMRFVWGLAMYDYPFFILTISQDRLPACATRGMDVVVHAYSPSIPNTAGNVLRPKWPSWTSQKPSLIAHS